MKRILLYILLIIINLSFFSGSRIVCQAEENGTTVEKDKIYARSAVLMDADSGRVLFEKEGNTVLPMASTTKIMTCILALEKGNSEDMVGVSAYAESMPDVQLNMRKGETYRLEDLLYSLMLESHNDSAVAIAEHIGGSVEGFASMMNQKAKEIGCTDTYFITPNGLDAQTEIKMEDGGSKTVMHSTTAKDLALIMSYCIKKSSKKEEFLKITQTASYNFSNMEGSRSFSCNNHNAFLNMMDGALSGKTGFTGKAGYCYVGALERDGKTFVVALLACGWPNHKTYKWSDTRMLMEYGIANYEKADLLSWPVKEECLKQIPVENAKTEKLFDQAAVEVYIETKKNIPMLLVKKGEIVTVKSKIAPKLEAPVRKDQIVGTIYYILNDKVIWERNIRTKSGLEEKDYSWYVKKIFLEYVDADVLETL